MSRTYSPVVPTKTVVRKQFSQFELLKAVKDFSEDHALTTDEVGKLYEFAWHLWDWEDSE